MGTELKFKLKVSYQGAEKISQTLGTAKGDEEIWVLLHQANRRRQSLRKLKTMMVQTILGGVRDQLALPVCLLVG